MENNSGHTITGTSNPIDVFDSLLSKLKQRANDYCNGSQATTKDLLCLLIEDYTLCFDYALSQGRYSDHCITLIDTTIRLMEHCKDAESINYASRIYTGDSISVSIGLINKFTLKSLPILLDQIPEQARSDFHLRLAELFYQWGQKDKHKKDIAFKLIVPLLAAELLNPTNANTSSTLSECWEPRLHEPYDDLLQTLVKEQAKLSHNLYLDLNKRPLFHGQTISALQPLINFWRAHESKLEHNNPASYYWQSALLTYLDDAHIPGLLTWFESISCDESLLLIDEAFDQIESILPIWLLMPGAKESVTRYYQAIRHFLQKVKFPETESKRVNALARKILECHTQLMHQPTALPCSKPTLVLDWRDHLINHQLNQQRFFETIQDSKTIAQHQLSYSKNVSRIINKLCSELVHLIDHYAGVIPPGNFALMGLGSLAREELVPSSDFDCALLLDESLKSLRAHPYFQSFIRLLQTSFLFLPGLEIDEGDLANFSFSESKEGKLINTVTGYLPHTNHSITDPATIQLVHSIHRMVPVFAYEKDRVVELSALGQQYRQAVAVAYGLGLPQEDILFRADGMALLREHSKDPWYPSKNNYKERYVNPLLYWLSDVVLWLGLQAADGGLILNPLEMIQRLQMKGHLDPAFATELTEAYRLIQLGRAYPDLVPDLESELNLIEEQIIAPLYRHISDLLQNITMVNFDLTLPVITDFIRNFERLDPLPNTESAQFMAILNRWQTRGWTIEETMVHLEQFNFSGMQWLHSCLMQEQLKPELSPTLRTYWQRLATKVAYQPDRSGQRVVRQLAQETWQYKLSAILGPSFESVPRANESTAGYLESTIFIGGHWSKRYYQIPIASELQACLWQDKRIKAKPKGQGGQHHALPVIVNGQHVWFKLLPEQPAMSLAVNELVWRIAGEGVPDSSLLTWVLPNGNRIVVEVIDHVEGENLFKVLQGRNANEQLSAISKASFTGHLLRVLLTHPEDDKEDDYFLVPASSINRESGARFDLRRIDTERAFFPVDAATGWFGTKQLQIKSILCCFEAMLAPLDEGVLRDFLILSPLAVLKDWLDVLSQAATGYRHLFTESMLAQHFAAQWRLPGISQPGLSLITPFIPIDTVSALYDRFEALHNTIHFKLARGESLNGLTLLSIVNSSLADYYSVLFNMPHSSLLTRFGTVTQGLYKTVKGQRQSTLTGIRVLNTQIGDKLTYEKVRLAAYQGGEGSPELAGRWLRNQGKIKVQEALEALLSEQDIAVKLIQLLAQKQRLTLLRIVIKRMESEVPNASSTSVEDALPSSSSAQEANHLNTSRVSLRSQRLLLQGLVGTQFTALNLSHFSKELDDTLVQSLLQGAGTNLLDLQLSGERLSITPLTQLPKWHPYLHRLHLSYLGTAYTSLEFSWESSLNTQWQLMGLTNIILSYIPKLSYINFNLPSLEHAHFEQLSQLGTLDLTSTRLASLTIDSCTMLRNIQLSAPSLTKLQLVNCDWTHAKIIHDAPLLTYLHLEKIMDLYQGSLYPWQSFSELLLNYFYKKPTLTRLVIQNCKNLSLLAERFFERLVTDKNLSELLTQTGMDSFKGLLSILSQGISQFVWREVYKPRELWWALLSLEQIDKMIFEFMPNAEDQSCLDAYLEKQTGFRELTLPFDVMQPRPYQEILHYYQSLATSNGYLCNIALIANAIEVGESAWLRAFAQLADELPLLSGILQPWSAQQLSAMTHESLTILVDPKDYELILSDEKIQQFIPWQVPPLLQLLNLKLDPDTNSILLDYPFIARPLLQRNIKENMGNLCKVLYNLLPRWINDRKNDLPLQLLETAANDSDSYALMNLLQKLTQTREIRSINLSYLYPLLTQKIISSLIITLLNKWPELNHVNYFLKNSKPAYLSFTGHTQAIQALVVLPNGLVVSGSNDNRLRIWDLHNHSCIAILSGHRRSVTGLALLPNGHLLSGSEDNDLRIWELERQTCISVMRVSNFMVLAILPNDQVAIGEHFLGSMSIWDLTTQRQKKFCGPIGASRRTHVTALVALPDGQLLSSGSNDNTLRLWNPAILNGITQFGKHDGRVTALVVLPDARVVSSSSNGFLYLWDLSTKKRIAVLEERNHRITALAVRPDGRVVSGDDKGNLRLWDMDALICIGELNYLDLYDLLLMSQLPPNGEPLPQKIYLETVGRKLIYVYKAHGEDTIKGELSIRVDKTLTISMLSILKESIVAEIINSHNSFNHQITSLAILPDGRTISGSEDGNLLVWPAWQGVRLDLSLRSHWQEVCSWYIEEERLLVVELKANNLSEQSISVTVNMQESLEALHRLIVAVFSELIKTTRWHDNAPGTFTLELRTHLDLDSHVDMVNSNLSQHDLRCFMQALLQSAAAPNLASTSSSLLTVSGMAINADAEPSNRAQQAPAGNVSSWTPSYPTFFAPRGGATNRERLSHPRLELNRQ